MRYDEAIAKLFALESRGIRMGVQRMADALAFRGHPDEGQLLIHVAGTNGKGSVATMLSECLRAAGYRTGLFTSPHLHRWVERIRIDGRPLAEREAARRIVDILGAFDAPGAPETTFFELTTLAAVEAFRDHRCEVAVMEVGLGGRLDATNATTPVATVITRIALDHTRFLGDTLGKIAAEKAGILEPGVPLVCGVRGGQPRQVIARRARRLDVPVSWAGADFEVLGGSGRFGVRSAGRVIDGLRLGLAGDHQRDNAACAIATLDALRAGPTGLSVDDDAIRTGLRRVRWPARMEWLRGAPDVLLDAAHNLDGCQALAAHVASQRHAGRRVLVFGAMRDKDFPAMLRTLAPCFDRVIYCPPRMRRAATYAALNRAVRGRRARGTGDALHRARRAAGEDGLVVVAGSIFLIADARERLKGVRSDPFIRM